MMKCPPLPRKEVPPPVSKEITNQNDLDRQPEPEISVVSNVSTEEVRIDLLDINHIVPEKLDLQNFPGYKPKV